MNTATKGDLLLYFLNQSDSTAIMVGTESLARYVEVAAQAPKVTRVVIIDEPGVPPVAPPNLARVSIMAYAALESGADRAPEVSVDIHEPHGILHIGHDGAVQRSRALQRRQLGVLDRPGAVYRLPAGRRDLHMPAAIPR